MREHWRFGRGQQVFGQGMDIVIPTNHGLSGQWPRYGMGRKKGPLVTTIGIHRRNLVTRDGNHITCGTQ
jgi:hypothetical protein